MAGSLDTLLRSVAKNVVSDLGSALDTKITYKVVSTGTYNKNTGAVRTSSTSYTDITAPIEFIESFKEDGRQVNKAKIYVSPSIIGNNQPKTSDEIFVTFEGQSVATKIENIVTYGGGQNYLYIIEVLF
tara:strand:+ start:18 stop:404 length:387 start_codon:yes stop_codon:yes gene_type:complete